MGCADTPPTWPGVLVKISQRLADAKPAALTRPDLECIAAAVAAAGTVKPIRYGLRTGLFGEGSPEVTPPSNAEEAYGLILDLNEHNIVRTVAMNPLLELIRRVDDPEFEDLHWNELFGRRGIRANRPIDERTSQ